MSEPFDATTRATLVAVLDEIIPPCPERSLPGAGEAGCLRAIDAAVAGSPETVPVLTAGAQAADEAARERGADDFASLAREQRRAALDAIAPTQPAFVASLVFHTYADYYTVPEVVEALGMEARPPHPKGYEVPGFDTELLEPVRRRGPLFRSV